MTAKVSARRRIQIVPLDPAIESRNLNVTPFPRQSEVAGDIRHRVAWRYALQLNTVRVYTLVSAGPGTLRGNHQIRVALRPRCEAELNVSVPYDAVWAPVFELVRKNIGIHERAPVLTSAESPQFAPRVSQPERRLPGVHASTEHLELKNRLQLPQLRRNVAGEAQAALPHARVPISVFAKLVL